MSVGIYITFGKFRTVHLGDLTKNKEFELMCPKNRLGTVDVLLGLHHGQASSNSPVLVHALHPRVAIMNDGTRKGGEPETMQTVHSSPGLEDLWQMHFSLLSGQEYTEPGMFIANTTDDPQPHADCSDCGAAARTEYASAAAPQWHGLLDQAVGADGRHLHGDQRAQRLQQDLQQQEGRREGGLRAEGRRPDRLVWRKISTLTLMPPEPSNFT